MKRYGHVLVLVVLVVFVAVYATVTEVGVLHVLATADVGWGEAPSWNVPLMLWGILLNGAGVLLELMPYLVFGILLGGFLSEFVSRAAIEKHSLVGCIVAGAIFNLIQ
jgi:hypothetical protein